LLSACAGSTPLAEHERFTVWFEPALSAPAEASVAHESGYVWRGTASPSSVQFAAPEGPCTLTLARRGEVVAETSLRLVRGVPEQTWRLRP